jgi:hypothetical protein
MMSETETEMLVFEFVPLGRKEDGSEEIWAVAYNGERIGDVIWNATGWISNHNVNMYETRALAACELLAMETALDLEA